MLLKTHLAISLLAILILLSSVEYQAVFTVMVLISTLIPDIDTEFSGIGKKKVFRMVQFFARHRGLLHSFTFLLLVTLFFVLFMPVVALGFFLGYALHLLADSFTIEGIKPLYPFGKTINGKLRTGGRIETSIFIFFVVANLFIFGLILMSLF